MKNLILLFILIFPSFGFSQSYRLIEKAERKIEQKEYAKALNILKRAENADYGFCGTAYIEAIISINNLRFKIFKETNDNDGMQKYLEGVNPFLEFTNVYSIERMRLARLRFNDSDLNNRIIDGLKVVKEDDKFEFGDLVPIKIDGSYGLKLFFRTTDIWELQKKENLAYNDALIRYYKNSEYFKLLNQ